MQKISILIPAFNEEAFIATLLDKLISIKTMEIGFEKEIIVINDGSTDNTSQIVAKYKEVLLINQSNNGKGSAVANGIQICTGNYILIQDADLEYEPNDIIIMLNKLMQCKEETAIYGSRILGVINKDGFFKIFPGKHKKQKIINWIANIILSIVTYILYRKWITDTLTGYKLYPAKIIKEFNIVTRGFETDHEITAKLIKKKIKIIEVPVGYIPRTTEEGKKIKAKDGLIALLTLIRFSY